MKLYNFLAMLNETRNVLWHESCKCVCKLNSLVCNNKQTWNYDNCRYDCNEDFAGIINCAKGYTWNPSTCECQCDMWCKPGQYSQYTPLYFFSSNNKYFARKEPIKVKIFETFKCSDQNLSNSSCQFSNSKSIPLQILYHSSVS